MDRLAQTICALAILLGALFPTLLGPTFVGLRVLHYTIAILLIPFAIAGFCLLFPRLSLASYAAQEKVTTLCQTLSSAVSALVKGFCAADYADLYTADVDHLLIELDKDLNELTMLKLFVESEALIFPSLKRYAAALSKFISILKNIVYEVSSVRDTLKSLLHNKTQAKFVDLLRPILEDLSADIEILIYILNEHIGVGSGFTIRIFPIAMVRAISALFYSPSINSATGSASFSEKNIPSSPQRLHSTRCHEIDISGDDEKKDYEYKKYNLRDRKIRNMSDRRNLYQEGMHTAEERTFFTEERTFHHGDIEKGGGGEKIKSEGTTEEGHIGTEAMYRKKELNQTIHRLKSSNAEMLTMYRRVRAQYIFPSSLPCSEHSDGSLDSFTREDDGGLGLAAVLAESKILSLRNTCPRAACLNRICLLTELFSTLDTVLEDSPNPISLMSDYWSFFQRNYVTSRNYTTDVFMSYTANIYYIVRIFIPVFFSVLICKTETATSAHAIHVREVQREVKLKFYELVNTYAQPLKGAVTITIASFFVLIPEIASRISNGFWICLVTVIIRRDNSSSSFSMGYQRLEGTAIGAVYAYALYTGFQCTDKTCGFEISTPILVIWIGICAFFRDGPRHGYAALVAGFTPIVLFLGVTPAAGNHPNQYGAWQRIETTFIGIAIFLIVDNLILPNRSDVSLRTGMLKRTEQTRVAVRESMAGMAALMTITLDIDGNIYMQQVSKEIERTYLDERDKSGSDIHFTENHEKKEDTVMFTHLHETDKSSSDLPSNRLGLGLGLGERTCLDETDESSSDIPSESVPNYKLSDGSMSIFTVKFAECTARLKTSDAAIGHLKGAIGKDYADLGLVLDEPEIWRSSFPTDAYRPLIICFSDVTKASRSVSSAVRSFCAILQAMVDKGEEEQVILHLHTLSFMTKHLLVVFNLIDIALRLASSADSTRMDLSALVTLSRRCEALLSDVDHHYREIYSTLNLDFLANLNPTLLIAFQDVFHSVHSAVEHLSHLGIALRTVRDVEALIVL